MYGVYHVINDEWFLIKAFEKDEDACKFRDAIMGIPRWGNYWCVDKVKPQNRQRRCLSW